MLKPGVDGCGNTSPWTSVVSVIPRIMRALSFRLHRARCVCVKSARRFSTLFIIAAYRIAILSTFMLLSLPRVMPRTRFLMRLRSSRSLRFAVSSSLFALIKAANFCLPVTLDFLSFFERVLSSAVSCLMSDVVSRHFWLAA